MSTPAIADVAALTLPTVQNYCAYHRYAIADECDTLDASRPPSWGKVKLLQRELPRTDWCLWIDADAAILNQSIRIESLLDPEADLVIARDGNGINAGVFAIRNCHRSHIWLQAVWNQTDCIAHYWWEQKAMMNLLDRGEPELRVAYIDKRLMNAYPGDYRAGDFILHLPGRANRAAIMAGYMAKPKAA